MAAGVPGVSGPHAIVLVTRAAEWDSESVSLQSMVASHVKVQSSCIQDRF